MGKEMINNFVRISEVKKATGLSRSTIYLRISQGSYPRPIKLGARAVGWPSKEVAALNAARMAGKSEDEIRMLVSHIESSRSNCGEKIVLDMMA